MTSAIGLLVEEARQRSTNDRLFWRRLPPVFELQVPVRVSGGVGTSYLFPLPMPPQEMSVDYPFAVEITPTMGGGIVVEENGVPTVDIRIAGTMGQRPKQYRGGYFGLIEPSERRLSGHNATQRTSAVTGALGLTGHRFLQHLKSSVFGLYADLKRDPETAEETRLILHNPKDDEHFVVVPQRFRMPRDVGRSRLVWNYEITLTGVELAKALEAPSEDKSILAKLAGAAAQIRAMIRVATAAINDLNRIRGEIERFARQFVGALDDMTSILEDLDQFVAETKRSVTTTRARIAAVADRLERALEEDGANISDDTAAIAMEVISSVHGILLHPEAFTPSSEERTEAAFRRGLGLLSTRSRSALTAAASSLPPASERELRSASILPGDVVRDDQARALPEELRRYRSAFEVDLRPSDTLEMVAARYLGDARLWRHIAIINDLREPYISPIGYPHTALPGSRILVPSVEASARRAPNPAVLGSDPDDPPDVRELGTDWLVEYTPAGLEDWAVDEEGGAVDLRTAQGVACVSQDLRARIETPQGSDPLYRTFGTGQVVGFGEASLEDIAVSLRVAESLEADPRVREADVTVERPRADVVSTSARVFLRGLRDTVAVQGSTLPPAPP